MNAAARLLNQGALSRGWVISMFVTRSNVSVMLTVMTILFSALSLVYVTHCSRSLNANVQQALVERDHLHLQWGQLLLEQSTLLTQARVESAAEDHLAMLFPEGKSLVLFENDK